MKILQIGPYSYVGGVSVHVKRLVFLLDKDCCFEYIDESPSNLTPNGILNIRKRRDQLNILKLIRRQDVIHIHSGNWLFRIYFIFLSTIFQKNFVVTLHSYRIKGYKKKVTEVLLRNAKLIIAVSEEIRESLSSRLLSNVLVKEAFLPPHIFSEPSLSKDLLDFIESFSKDITLVCANAFRLTKMGDYELYGLDQCIEVAEKSKKEAFRIHIVFIIGTVKDEDLEYYNSFLKIIKNKELEELITVIPKSVSFIRLIQHCDIVLRPTLTDGDALTVREALFFKKPIIASDVVNRPLGTYLYKTGDSESLFEKIKKVSLLKESLDDKQNNVSIENYRRDYLNIYKQCNN